MKILHLPTLTGGNAFGLSRGERALGLQSDVLIHKSNMYEKFYDILAPLSSVKALAFFQKWKVFFSIRNKYDLFHFNFGQSLFSIRQWPFLNLLDLPFYTKDKKLFVTYNGCDARQKYPTMKRRSIAPCHEMNCYSGLCNSGSMDNFRRQSIEKMSHYVRHMWALNPDLLHFLPKEKSSFLPYTVASNDLVPTTPRFGKKLRILHAPTNYDGKGSAFILKSLYELEKKYPDQVELNIFSGLPYEEALNRYREADLIVEQLLAGWYGAQAVELMLMGKPVITYINIEDLHFIPPQMREDLLETVISADPHNLFSVLESCLFNRTFLKERSEASITYARKWHDPKFVAAITKEKYEAM